MARATKKLRAFHVSGPKSDKRGDVRGARFMP